MWQIMTAKALLGPSLAGFRCRISNVRPPHCSYLTSAGFLRFGSICTCCKSPLGDAACICIQFEHEMKPWRCERTDSCFKRLSKKPKWFLVECHSTTKERTYERKFALKSGKRTCFCCMGQKMFLY